MAKDEFDQAEIGKLSARLMLIAVRLNALKSAMEVHGVKALQLDRSAAARATVTTLDDFVDYARIAIRKQVDGIDVDQLFTAAAKSVSGVSDSPELLPPPKSLERTEKQSRKPPTKQKN